VKGKYRNVTYTKSLAAIFITLAPKSVLSIYVLTQMSFHVQLTPLMKIYFFKWIDHLTLN